MTPRAALRRALLARDRLAIAVSGGVDSMLLAHVAQEVLSDQVRMIHAISPAVPAMATERVRRHARRAAWRLDIVDAREFDDPRYRANPVNRCYYCKANLYGTIAGLADGPIASGTNCDDLDDFRPGLVAAQERGVIHPYVEAGLGKHDIYALAGEMGLEDLAALPAQPCLASRVETGLAVAADDLAFVERVERGLHARLGGGAVLRCRIGQQGVVLELAEALAEGPEAVAAAAEVARLCQSTNRRFLGFRAYRRGAAFLRRGEA